MIKKSLNQNTNHLRELKNIIEPDFIFINKPINRLIPSKYNKDLDNKDKEGLLNLLKDKINSIENCNLKKDNNNLVFGEGNLDSQLMIIGEAPGENEEKNGLPFQGEVGTLLNKMLIAIGINRKKIYTAYVVNFRPPKDRKPTVQEIKRYSSFLKEHISIIDPKIIILMGATAMDAVTGLKNNISNERGEWKETIFKSKTIPTMITYSPSYLIRYPENKKYSWADLKKIHKKIRDLNIKI
tara:strand:+ start:1581 stop:2300 length:720 start_codon:yes stop_codon:yes gene_type:complete